MAAIFGAVSLSALIGLGFHRWRWRTLAAYFALFVLLLVWWQTIKPSNERDWQTDVAILPYAEIEGDIVTVHNIRNFDYRSETDYTPAYYDKRFDLRKLEGVDLVAVYWMGPAIAHIFVSFAFAGGDHWLFPLRRARRRKRAIPLSGASSDSMNFTMWSPMNATSYGCVPTTATIHLKTFTCTACTAPLENVRRVFLGYMNKINALQTHPEFYNTLTTNCTTGIYHHTLVNPEHLPLSWKILASGYVPEYAYEAGRLDNRLPFSELKRRAHINARAKAANGAADFSRLIREAPETAVTTPSTPQAAIEDPLGHVQDKVERKPEKAGK